MIIEPNLYKQWLTAAPFVFSILIVTIIIFSFFIYYKISMKKLGENEVPGGLALIIFLIINYFRNVVRDLLGDSFEKYTPFFLSIFFYIWVSNLIGIIELSPPTASITVTASLGLMTWIGTQVIGIRHQKFFYLNSFCFTVNIKTKNNKKLQIPILPNPIEILGKFTPLISISFRLWGNIFAGVLIISLVYNIPFIFTDGMDIFGSLISGETVRSNPIVIISSLIAPPLHLYLDIMTGTIQAYVFLILTMVYWTMAKEPN